MTRLAAFLLGLLALGTAAAGAQGWERSYLLSYANCTQPSLLTFGEATERFPGFLSQRPSDCGRTSCTYQYVSTIEPNALLQALYGMIEGAGYRARIGVEGLRYAITCLPGRRVHPLAGEPRVTGFAEFTTPCGAVIDADGDVLFDFDDAAIRPDAIPVLAAIAERARALRPLAIEITGHTDSRGPDAYNQDLSERRAASVAGYLAGPLALRGPRLLTRGLGEREPRRPNTLPDGRDDPIGRQANRRVEIFLRTADGPGCPVHGGGAALFRPFPPVSPGAAARPSPRPAPPARPIDPERW